MAENFDVVVIGAGPAGYVAAIRAAQLKQKVAIVDKQWLGGVCLNVGCIPSKSLLKNAEVAHTLRERGKDFGFSFDNLKLDYSVAVKRSRQNSDRLVKGVGFLMRKNAITVFMGEAKLKDKNTIVVTDAEKKTTELNAKNMIIATGATAVVPAAWKPDAEKIVTYLEAILQQKLPKSVVIIGSGAIGVEFATIWRSYGVEVTIVEMLPRLVPLEDEEVSKDLKKEFEKRGIKCLVGNKVEAGQRRRRVARLFRRRRNHPDGSRRFRNQYSRNERSRGSDSRSFTRLVAALLAIMSSGWQIGNPSTSTRRCHASSKRSIPSGANTKSKSKGPFLSWTKSLPRSISAACSRFKAKPNSRKAVIRTRQFAGDFATNRSAS